MKRIFQTLVPLLFLYLPASLQAQTGESAMNYTVSMDNPSQHYFHVEFLCEGINKQSMDLKMPAWTPGYYMILDLAKYVINFHAFDDRGNELYLEKIDKNTWRVKTGNTPSFKVSYDVFAYVQTVAHPFLDDGRGFISPTGVFMYLDGYLDHPVNVTVRPYHKWHNISTGLASAEGNPDTWHAEDFDELYDCPILAGNPGQLRFMDTIF